MGILDNFMQDPSVLMGIGLLAGNRGQSRGEALGNALQGGLQTYGWGQQLQANQALAAMRAMEMQQRMAQQQRLQGLLAGLPEDERAMAMAAPDEYVKGMLRSRFPGNDSLKVVGPGAQVIIPDSNAPGGVRVAHTNPYAYRAMETPYGVGIFDVNPGREGASGGAVAPQVGGPRPGAAAPNLPMPWSPGGLAREKRLGEEEGKSIGEYRAKVSSMADEAGELDRQLDVFDLYLRDAYQGSMAGLVTAGAKALRAAGVDLESWGIPNPEPAEAVRLLSNQTALRMRNPDSGFGLPGATSDADREFLLQMAPGINNTRGGNQMMIATNRAFNAHKRKLAAFVEGYSGDPAGLRQAVREWTKSNSTIQQDILSHFPHPKSAGDLQELRSGDVFIDPKGEFRVVP